MVEVYPILSKGLRVQELNLGCEAFSLPLISFRGLGSGVTAACNDIEKL